jgi:hypothetical protein
MDTILKQNKLFSDSILPASYFKRNLNIEKRSSVNWLQRFYKESLIKDVWLILSSRMS